MLKMPKHYALNGHRSGCNGVCSEQAGDGPKYEPTNATKPIAATTTPPAALQLRAQDGSVPLLVRAQLHELMDRSEEHTSELQSLMRISYAGYRLKKKKLSHQIHLTTKHNN